MSEFRAALKLCGLSQQDAARITQASFSSIDKWSRGLGTPPQAVWEHLAAYWQAVERSAAGKPDRDAGIRLQGEALARLRSGLPAA